MLHYIDGDYNDPATFDAVRQKLGAAEHPAHYLAIPPPLFGRVVEQLARSGAARGARVVVEKPFGQDLTSARELNRILLGAFVERDIFRIDHYLGKRPVNNILFFRFNNPLLQAFWDRNHVESMQITMAEDFGIQGRGGFYDATGAVRDVVQNHLFQVLSNLVMEPPARMDSESLRDERVKVLKSVPPLGRGMSSEDSSADIALRVGSRSIRRSKPMLRSASESIRPGGTGSRSTSVPENASRSRRPRSSSACGSRQPPSCSRTRLRCRITSASESSRVRRWLLAS